MLRHRKPFKSNFEIREFETKRSTLRNKVSKNHIRDDGKNNKLEVFDEKDLGSGEDNKTGSDGDI